MSVTASSKIVQATERFADCFAYLESRLNGLKDSFTFEMRREALEKFRESGFPTTRHEEWKYSNIQSFYKNALPQTDPHRKQLVGKLEFNDYPHIRANKLVFVNGQYSRQLSIIEDIDKQIQIGSLNDYLVTQPELLGKYYNRSAELNEDAIGALNTAFAENGAFVHVPKNTVLEYPIFMIFLYQDEEDIILHHPRNLVIAEENSKVQLIEAYQNLDQHKAFYNNSYTEIFLRANAQLDFIKIQDEKRSLYHIGTKHVFQDRYSRFNCVTATLAGNFIRNNMHVHLNAPNAECNLHGLFLGSEKNLVDNHLVVHHNKPNCLSNQLYKGILDDRSTGVFNGKIIVEEDAQKTEAYQSNKNILMSDYASINTKPQLEIFADDVKCSHGATSGQLDEAAQFYLEARGIPSEKAKAILNYAFVHEILGYVPVPELREYLCDELRSRLKVSF